MSIGYFLHLEIAYKRAYIQEAITAKHLLSWSYVSEVDIPLFREH